VPERESAYDPLWIFRQGLQPFIQEHKQKVFFQAEPQQVKKEEEQVEEEIEV